MAGRTPFLSSFLLLSSTLAYPFFEHHAIYGFASGLTEYDFSIETLSDLGITYRQVHPLKHYAVTSHRAQSMNFAFLLLAGAFALAQALVFYSARRKGGNLLLRALPSAAFVGGLVLFATVHGGPRERVWHTQGWHWMGLGLAAIGGNLSTIFSALFPLRRESPFYRALAMGAGSFGLYSLYRWAFTLGEWWAESKVGLWERGALYPVFVWMFVRGVVGIVEWGTGWEEESVSDRKKKA